jgi:hypothetical protein
MEPYNPIPGKPPRKVVIDRQRKLFASLDIEELLLELVSLYLKFKPNALSGHRLPQRALEQLRLATLRAV